MTREKQLKYCKVCVHRKFNMKEGVICGLTNKVADFTESCELYEEDEVQKAVVEEKAKEIKYMNAEVSPWKRLINFLIDSIAVGLLASVIVALLPQPEIIYDPDDFYNAFKEEPNNLELIKLLISLGVTFVYYTILETSSGITLGKLVSGTRVTKNNGDEVDFGSVLLRSICRFIPFEFVSFIGSKSGGWHDKMSETVVVDIRKISETKLSYYDKLELARQSAE